VDPLYLIYKEAGLKFFKVELYGEPSKNRKPLQKKGRAREAALSDKEHILDFFMAATSIKEAERAVRARGFQAIITPFVDEKILSLGRIISSTAFANSVANRTWAAKRHADLIE
jgi:hypothetical protein